MNHQFSCVIAEVEVFTWVEIRYPDLVFLVLKDYTNRNGSGGTWMTRQRGQEKRFSDRKAQQPAGLASQLRDLQEEVGKLVARMDMRAGQQNGENMVRNTRYSVAGQAKTMTTRR